MVRAAAKRQHGRTGSGLRGTGDGFREGFAKSRMAQDEGSEVPAISWMLERRFGLSRSHQTGCRGRHSVRRPVTPTDLDLDEVKPRDRAVARLVGSFAISRESIAMRVFGMRTEPEYPHQPASEGERWRARALWVNPRASRLTWSRSARAMCGFPAGTPGSHSACKRPWLRHRLHGL